MKLPQRQPNWRPDRDIQNDLLRNLNQNPLIDLNNVIIHVDQGKVIFDGQVPTPQQINIFEETARATRGVIEVISNLGPHGTDPDPYGDPPGIIRGPKPPGDEPDPLEEESGSHGPGPGPDD